MSMTKEETDAIMLHLQDNSEALEVALARLDNIATRLLNTRKEISKRVASGESFDDLNESEKADYAEFSETLRFSFEKILSLISLSGQGTTTYLELILSHKLMEKLNELR